MNILGISCYYHDAAAALLQDGQLIAASEEERFSRIKHDFGFPRNAINFCLESGGIRSGKIGNAHTGSPRSRAMMYHENDISVTSKSR